MHSSLVQFKMNVKNCEGDSGCLCDRLIRERWKPTRERERAMACWGRHKNQNSFNKDRRIFHYIFFFLFFWLKRLWVSHFLFKTTVLLSCCHVLVPSGRETSGSSWTTIVLHLKGKKNRQKRHNISTTCSSASGPSAVTSLTKSHVTTIVKHFVVE